jgi:predicted extracellular nuclease
MKTSGTLVLLLLFVFKLYPQEEKKNSPVRTMFYNVENLFDTFNDTLKDDEEFLPEGSRRWNKFRYKEKINSLYKVITAAGGWTPPDIIGMCEVENRKVLDDLFNGTYLSYYNYGIIHEESPDLRGIDVAFIYRKDVVSVIDHRSWIPATKEGESFRTRSVLFAKCRIYDDTICFIINHWPSRRGGVLAGENMRMAIAAMVRSAADSLAGLTAGRSKIIIMGDFNCTPDDSAIRILTGPSESGKINEPFLANLALPDRSSIPGTYRFQGTWELLDQMIVSTWLLKSAYGLYTEKKLFRIFKDGFLLKSDGSYPGVSPFPTYRGYKYQGGYSDHLPVLLDLLVHKKSDGG